MSRKDPALDKKITEAAEKEFLEHGFREASMRQIAQQAGLTTGALYSRYRNKDVLFCSLVEPALQKIAPAAAQMQHIYRAAWESRDPEQILAAIRREEQIYLQLMVSNYDLCLLFFCRSDGSSLQQKLQTMMEAKASQTVAFLRSLARQDAALDGVEVILCEQFHFFRHVLDMGGSREQAVTCIKNVEAFLEAGWKDLLERIL